MSSCDLRVGLGGLGHDVLLETGVAHGDDLVEVVLDALGTPLGADLGAEALEVGTELLGLGKQGTFYEYLINI